MFCLVSSIQYLSSHINFELNFKQLLHIVSYIVLLASILFCDFENKSCDWNSDEQYPYVWQTQHGEPDNPNTGPSIDHSTASGKHITLTI